MAKAFLAATPLRAVLSNDPHLVTVSTTNTVGQAAEKLVGILSVPVLDRKGEYAGCLSASDILKEIMKALKGADLHWQDHSLPSEETLKALGTKLAAMSVEDADHSGSLWLLTAGVESTLLDVVTQSFSIEEAHHVHHRVFIAAPASDAGVHSVSDGTITALNAVKPSSGSLRVTHVLSHFDVVRVLHENAASLDGLSDKTLEQLGLDEGAAFCVPASTPALTAFGAMATDEKSSLGLTDAEGKLVGNLSVSDVRGLTPETFGSLLLTAGDYATAHHGGAYTVVTVTSQTTFGELLATLVTNKLHRVYVVDGEGKATSIITLTDILRLAATH